MKKKKKAEIVEETMDQIFEDRKYYLKALRSLYAKVKHKIKKTSKFIGKRKRKKPKRKMVRKLDQLKYHRNQIKDMFYSVTLANEKEWRKLKADAKSVYHNAAAVV